MPAQPNLTFQATPGRMSDWVSASHKLAGWAGDTHLIQDIQDLGWVEATLLQIEGQLPNILARQHSGKATVDAEDLLLGRALGLSRLWLFGLYEAVRTYREALSKKKRRQGWVGFDEVGRLLNLVRAPLAKHRVAGKSEEHVATVLVGEGGRIGWAVIDPRDSTQCTVYRRQFADMFLDAAGGLIGAGEAEAMAAAARPAP